MSDLSHDRHRPKAQTGAQVGMSRVGKRMFDILFALALLPLALPLLIIAFAVILIREGRPIFYLSERMKAPTTPFHCVKLRTMAVQDTGSQSQVLGGYRASSITATGRFLRRSRLDELPQLYNILRGDMSFVGPRPPLRRYVESHPALYDCVLRNRPGVTGLATIIFHAHEEYLLGRAKTEAETQEIYTRRCIPRKARLDLIYQKNASFGLDLYILYLTAARMLPLPGGSRVRRIRRRSLE